jgi:hypothetical protein
MADVTGGPGPDSLAGGAEDDAIRGLGGDDTLTGNAGRDTIRGGAGADVIAGENASLPPLLPPSDNLIRGGGGDDTVRAGLGADTVRGGAGDDRIFGGIGQSDSTFLEGGAGENLVSDRADLLRGGRGDDRLDGAAGADTLRGGAGNDTLLGGPGVDLLAGGAGGDSFAFGFFIFLNPDTGVGEGARDVVADFEPGADRIDLSLYRDPLPFGPADEPPPVFLGTGPFVASDALQLRHDAEGGRTVLQFFSPFTMGSGEPRPFVPARPTGEIEFAGLRRLAAGDFAGEIEDRSGGPAPDGGGGAEVDWNALAARVLANFAATGQWFL